MNKLLFSFFLLVSTGWAFSAEQQSELADYLQRSNSFAANFSQKVSNSSQELVEESSGNMTFVRPGKFRWTYSKPYEQEIISNGKTLWIYDKDLEQVSIRPVDEGINKTPIMLLDDPSSISQEFIVESQPGSKHESAFRLTSRHEGAGFQSVLLVFNNYVLTEMKIHDNFDQISHLTFHDIQLDVSPPETLFNFEPPAGVDVIRAAEKPH